MKNIFDIYDINECGDAICSTPANTTGMGNPMPPGDGQVGSEPMVGKCKKEKSKKRKCSEPWTEPVVKEGILDDIETTLKSGSETIKFIEWFVDNQLVEHKKLDRDKLIKNYINVISVDNGVVIIDMSKDNEYFADEMVIKSPIPNGIHTVKVYNSTIVFHLLTYINDLSNINFEVYKDKGNKYSSLWCSWHNSVSGSVSVGNIICNAFRVMTSTKIDSLTIGDKSMIQEFDSSRTSLRTLKGKLYPATEVLFNSKLVKGILQSYGVIPPDCDFTISK